MVDAAMPNTAVCEALLVAVAPTLPQPVVAEYANILSATAKMYGITSPKALASWVSQMAHESGGFKYLVEIWGPTSQQRRYGVGSLARRLGNLSPADGYAFRGRGWIQLTGRANYAKYGKIIGQDLITNPDLAADPVVAFAIAAAYWVENGLNDIAEKQSIKAVTKVINGGYNGLADRMAKYKLAMSSLKENEYA